MSRITKKSKLEQFDALSRERDHTTPLDPNEEEILGAPWWVVYTPITPDRLRLLTGGTP